MRMKKRFRLMRRGKRGGKFYCVDSLTGKRESLGTQDDYEAEELVAARNNALRQPVLNLHLAKAYLAGTDSGITTRTWQQAADALIETKQGANRARWQRAIKDQALRLIVDRVIVETHADLVLRVLRVGTVSTNVFLRRLHNFCLDMNWLPWPIIPKRQWPAVRHKEKRAITLAEHCAIVAREKNPERKAYYQLAWYLGASQSDIAGLQASDIDWETRVVSYFRKKTKQVARVMFVEEVAAILETLPDKGPLFPYLITVRETDRATEFKQRCRGLGIEGVTLHSYRYAWAERAKSCGYPERFAQQALGHNSKAIARAYARNADVTVPSLEEYEEEHGKKKLIRLAGKKQVDGAIEANSRMG